MMKVRMIQNSVHLKPCLAVREALSMVAEVPDATTHALADSRPANRPTLPGVL